MVGNTRRQVPAAVLAVCTFLAACSAADQSEPELREIRGIVVASHRIEPRLLAVPTEFQRVVGASVLPDPTTVQSPSHALPDVLVSVEGTPQAERYPTRLVMTLDESGHLTPPVVALQRGDRLRLRCDLATPDVTLPGGDERVPGLPFDFLIEPDHGSRDVAGGAKGWNSYGPTILTGSDRLTRGWYGQLPTGTSITWIVEQGGKLSSTTRPWVTGHIYVCGHGAHALTDADGRFRIPGVRPGPAILVVRHERLQEVRLPLSDYRGEELRIVIPVPQKLRS